MLIEIESLSHTYAAGTPLERRALKDVSLHIDPGERVGVVGQTGSGKSTLMQHLAGLLTPTSGRVSLNGVPAHGRGAASRAQRQRVGIAFQYPEEQIFEQTVFREVAFGPHNLGLDLPQAAARVDWALKTVGLKPEAFVDRSPFNLSGGEMRRVALASILAMQPDVLILDEPTAGLDPRGRDELLDHVEAWKADSGRCASPSDAGTTLSPRTPTLIMVSHDLAALARLVDRAVVLHDGRIAADGPIQRVLSDRETLEAAGLRPPPAVALLYALQDTGWPLQTDRILPEEAAAEIAETHWRTATTSGLKPSPRTPEGEP